jgi:hypothetical protein
MLRDDTATWRASDEYNHLSESGNPFRCKSVFSCLKDYSQSRVHRERKRSATGRDVHYPTMRRESIATGVVTSPMPIPSQRPSMPHRNSSTSGSVTDSTFGSSYQNTHSYSQSSMYSSQSRRPSDAMLPGGPSSRSRTLSISSNSSDYGGDGYYGWRTGNGADGYYGWQQDNSPSAPQTRKP